MFSRGLHHPQTLLLFFKTLQLTLYLQVMIDLAVLKQSLLIFSMSLLKSIEISDKIRTHNSHYKKNKQVFTCENLQVIFHSKKVSKSKGVKTTF